MQPRSRIAAENQRAKEISEARSTKQLLKTESQQDFRSQEHQAATENRRPTRFQKLELLKEKRHSRQSASGSLQRMKGKRQPFARKLHKARKQ